MKTCLFHNAAYMELCNYISKYCEKIVLQRKYPTLCMISLYIMYVTTFYIKIIFHFPKKNNFMLATPWTEMYEGGATYLEIFFFMVVFPTAYYVNMSL